MRKARNLSLGVAGLMAVAGSAPAAPLQTSSNPAGRYIRSDPSKGDISVVREGRVWRIAIGAGGLPRGAGTAADCQLVAVGPLRNGRIVGRLVRSEDTAYDRFADEDTTGTITLIVRKGSVLVEEHHASSKYCGMGSYLGGTYVRR